MIEEQLIARLRNEAWQVKNCFTQFSFQALGLSVIAMGLIMQFQQDKPYMGLANIFVIGLLITVTRIGIFKYSAANRILGYELHLQRTSRLIEKKNSGWKASMSQIGWEEALRAWRIVQATIFEHVYERKNLFSPLRLKSIHSDVGVYRWYQPDELIKEANNKAVYRPGFYLKTMTTTLQAVAWIALVPIFVVPIQYAYILWTEKCPTIVSNWFTLAVKECSATTPIFLIISGILALLVLLALAQQCYSLDADRKIVESELKCIHSCAITWQIVVVAHARTLMDIGDNVEGKVEQYLNYTQKLSDRATEILLYFDPYLAVGDWIDDPRLNEPYIDKETSERIKEDILKERRSL